MSKPAAIRPPQYDVPVAGEGEPVEAVDVRKHFFRLRAQRDGAVAPCGEAAIDDLGEAVMALAEEEVAGSCSEREQSDQVARSSHDLAELSAHQGRSTDSPQRAVRVLATPADEAATGAEHRGGAVGSDDELERPVPNPRDVGEHASVMRDDLGRDTHLDACTTDERAKGIVERRPCDTEPAEAVPSVGIREIEDDPAAVVARDDAVDLLRASGDGVEDPQPLEHDLARRLQEHAGTDRLDRGRPLEERYLVALLGQ